MTEMGLAVLQQLKNKFEPSLFEHGELANMFAQAGNSQREGSFLRLVDKVQSNLSNASDSVIHSFEGFSDQERNIKSYNDIAEEDTFDYGIKELMKGPQDHDENISADNGYTKLGNVSPAGNNEKKARENWRFAFQMQMQRQQQEFMARLREQIKALEERLVRIKEAEKFLDSITQDDLKGDTTESRQKIEEAKQHWADAGLDANKIPMKNGQIDLEEAKRQMEKHRQDVEHKLEEKENELKKAQENNNETSFVSKKIDVNKMLVTKANTGSEAKAAISLTPSDDVEFETTAAISPTPSDDVEFETTATISPTPSDDVEFATETAASQSSDIDSLRNKYASAASQIDGVSNSVLSRSFTELALGTQKDSSVTPATTKPEFTSSPAALTMRA